MFNTLFPPSPPRTVKPCHSGSGDDGSTQGPLPSPPILDDPSQLPPIYPLPPRVRPKSVLAADLETPDSHVTRDARLIRLTGLHPLNAEAPLSDLFDEGFLTSENLHYVRNHGHVPQCQDRHVCDWTFSVEGMVAHPFALSLRDLIATYDQVTDPVTLVCAGNRRKEQNVIRKSKGFSWGPAGLSTALWTGTPIRDLLARAKPLRGAKYVCLEGADKLSNGHYGTSVKLSWCMDVQKGILVAHKMNGRALHPDHGKPLRAVVPGQIGGRSVKWMKRIVVTADPSDNCYHIYNNRVLPTTVTPEASADLPETWRDERYAIYDLNANSAVCYPAHDERISLVDGASMYKIRGYAYGGGGRRITRMELTLDRGKTWRLSNMDYPEDRYRAVPETETLCGGKVDAWWRDTSFCWCFWEVDIAVAQLEAAGDIMVRAMDDGLMVQPRDMYWSVLGMMNNPWFRVVIHKEGTTLRFEHPTQPGLMPGGWMERKAVQQLAETRIQMTSLQIDRLITLDELKDHGDETRPWFVVDGNVYDGAPFLDRHPGGAASIAGAAGQDATEEFMAIHSENARAMMPEHHIGRLDEAALAALSDKVEESDPSRPVFLDPGAWTKAVLQEKVNVSADTKLFRFRLDHKRQVVGLPVGQHLLMRLRDPASREDIIRAYTPISDGADQGVLDVLVKIYYNTSERQGGKMTQALDAILVGHFVDFRGPLGKFQYLGKGLCSVSGRQRKVRRFYMICAGSGITPIFQVLRALSADQHDATECTLLDGNRIEEDILCRAQLEDMMGRRGRIDRAMVEAEIGPRDTEGGDMVLLCGPEKLERSMRDILSTMGWTDDHLVVF
ncbi:mo-co oxidoreductase domain-containing protein [Hirsutella rhossiliensis]|uniref:Nitrate reductase [NADPH] n=1 Tax=Hirsutella rhossiliensis TaxID=111463 RepID=A0A9P8SKU5_9HYPO|nr:mo-co oxidoreductase domain-containing protein [Hirsutella rhossiliensis]KAH0964476.1 mo-co oxidoreductase domain-containing protein [Hirsutella rhossiliensis]